MRACCVRRSVRRILKQQPRDIFERSSPEHTHAGEPPFSAAVLATAALLLCKEALRSDKMKSSTPIVALGTFLSLSVDVHAFNLQSAHHLVPRGCHHISEGNCQVKDIGPLLVI